MVIHLIHLIQLIQLIQLIPQIQLALNLWLVVGIPVRDTTIQY